MHFDVYDVTNLLVPRLMFQNMTVDVCINISSTHCRIDTHLAISFATCKVGESFEHTALKLVFTRID